MLRLRRLATGVTVLGLLLLGALVGCIELSNDRDGHETVDTPPTESMTMPRKNTSFEPEEDPLWAETDGITNGPPCTDAADVSCAPRDVSSFSLFVARRGGAAYVADERADPVEDALEKGLRLAEASPTHLAVRGTTVGSSIRCAWRGVARTVVHREQAIRFWLGLNATDALPTATEVERRFMDKLDALNLAFPETTKADFRAMARGGLNTEYLFLTCFVDFTASEYLLGAGPSTLTVAYDHMTEARSYALYRRAHTAGEFGSTTLLSASAYQAALIRRRLTRRQR